MPKTETRYKIYSDGGARGNPGPAAVGWIILSDTNEVIAIDGEYIGEQTNNFAEYSAIISALKKIKKLQQKNAISVTNIDCHLDSELIVKQLNGLYKVKNQDLKALHQQVKSLIEVIEGEISFTHVRREDNKVADKLVNICLDAREK